MSNVDYTECGIVYEIIFTVWNEILFKRGGTVRVGMWVFCLYSLGLTLGQSQVFIFHPAPVRHLLTLGSAPAELVGVWSWCPRPPQSADESLLGFAKMHPICDWLGSLVLILGFLLEWYDQLGELSHFIKFRAHPACAAQRGGAKEGSAVRAAHESPSILHGPDRGPDNTVCCEVLSVQPGPDAQQSISEWSTCPWPG